MRTLYPTHFHRIVLFFEMYSLSLLPSQMSLIIKYETADSSLMGLSYSIRNVTLLTLMITVQRGHVEVVCVKMV